MKNENTNTKNNLKTDIMDKIESGRVKIKSKVQARGEEIGFVLALIISIFGSAFTFNMLIFWARGSGHLHYLGLGGFGIFVFMRSFPHLWFWLAIVLIASAYFVLRHFDFSYKKPLGWIIAGLAVICLVVTFAFASSPINKPFQKQAQIGKFGAPRAIFAPHMLPPKPTNGIFGTVIEIDDKKILLDCCNNNQIEGKITDRTRFIPSREDIVPNIEVHVIGKKSNGEIEAIVVARQDELQNRMRFYRK